MKPISVVSLCCPAVLLLCSHFPAPAKETVPCLIFTGPGQSERCYDLAKQNRIYFEGNGMTVTSANEDAKENTFLSYSEFKAFKIGMRVPSEFSLVDAINAGGEGGTTLKFISDTQSISIQSDSEGDFAVGIYDATGKLIATSKMTADQMLSVRQLAPGMYIAAATDGERKATVKFIIK